jgi:hypothetical protein
MLSFSDSVVSPIADDDVIVLRSKLAASNSKLNSNPSCRTSLTQSAENSSDAHETWILRATTVRFSEDPVEMPPQVFFDCSKIRKLDKVFPKQEDFTLMKRSCTQDASSFVAFLKSDNVDDFVCKKGVANQSSMFDLAGMNESPSSNDQVVTHMDSEKHQPSFELLSCID